MRRRTGAQWFPAAAATCAHVPPPRVPAEHVLHTRDAGGYVLPGRQTSGAGGAAAAAAGAPAGTRAIRINDLQDDEDGANAPNTSSQVACSPRVLCCKAVRFARACTRCLHMMPAPP